MHSASQLLWEHLGKPVVSGIVAQLAPLGAGGRYGAGFLVPVEADHNLEIASTGLRTLSQVVRELGVNHTTVQSHMRQLGYGVLSRHHGRWFDDAIVERLRATIPSLTWREAGERTRARWTGEELALVRQAMAGTMEWSDVAAAVKRTRRACYIAAGRLRRRDGMLEAAE